MNSIAFMPKNKQAATPTKESLVITAALADTTKSAVAKHMGVSDGLIYQWASGRRPVPAHQAPRLAKCLGVSDPAAVSAAYAKVQQSTIGNVVPMPNAKDADQRRSDLVIARLENDVDSLRFALAAMTAVMKAHRPTEAADAAKTIRRRVPAKFVNQGFLHELLQVLEAGA